VGAKASMRYHPLFRSLLNSFDVKKTDHESQFDWGGLLPNCNGGAYKVSSGKSS